MAGAILVELVWISPPSLNTMNTVYTKNAERDFAKFLTPQGFLQSPPPLGDI